FKISGVPITNRDGVLVGILTNRDVRFCSPEDYKRPVTDFMTSEDLVTAPEGTTLEQARSILQKHRIEKLPLVDGKGRLRGLITVKDIMKRQEFPQLVYLDHLGGRSRDQCIQSVAGARSHRRLPLCFLI
ncbi:MAG: CBS domain-containing protein, partial [Actinobacteria bacterium]|nr:CBS domain-containing protein [Actinomycetota bacterium]